MTGRTLDTHRPDSELRTPYSELESGGSERVETTAGDGIGDGMVGGADAGVGSIGGDVGAGTVDEAKAMVCATARDTPS